MCTVDCGGELDVSEGSAAAFVLVGVIGMETTSSPHLQLISGDAGLGLN